MALFEENVAHMNELLDDLVAKVTSHVTMSSGTAEEWKQSTQAVEDVRKEIIRLSCGE